MKLEDCFEAIRASIAREGELPNVRESKIGRIYQHMEDPESKFAIISANRSENSDSENIASFSELKKIVRKELGLGYIELVGGYVETAQDGTTVEVVEPSLLIPGIKKSDALDLGQKYRQESILMKNGRVMQYLRTTGNIGEVDGEFKCCDNRGNFTLKSAMTPYFSRLRKGGDRNVKISFVLKERNYRGETFRKAFSDGKSAPLWEDGEDSGTGVEAMGDQTPFSRRTSPPVKIHRRKRLTD